MISSIGGEGASVSCAGLFHGRIEAILAATRNIGLARRGIKSFGFDQARCMK